MKRIFATVVFAWYVGFASATIADPPGSDAAALKLQLMKTTQIVAVMDFPGAPDKFVPDNDPDSLQIVFLAKHFQRDQWKSLTVPRNKSAEFNVKVASGEASQR